MNATQADRPLASVVIPTYNDVDLLFGALDRVKAQTWPNVETIVVDDGSAEPVEPRIADRLGDDRIVVLRRPVNGGVPAALQAGLERARGDYIYFSSTNDHTDPIFLQASIEALERHPTAGLCFCDPGIVESWSETLEEFPLHLAREETCFTADEFAARLRRRPFHLASNTVVFRARSVLASGGSRPELKLYADWFACMATALREGAVYLPKVMAYFRMHDGAYSGRGQWRDGARARLLATAIRTLESEAPEVLERLRRSAAVSEFGLPILLALARDPHGRGAISAEALWLALARSGWRRMLPRRSRSFLRRVATRAQAA